MFNISDLFKSYVTNSNREFQAKAVINSTIYDSDKVVEFDIEESLVPGEEFVLGSVIASKLTLSVRTSDIIPSNSKIIPYLRMDGVPWASAAFTWFDADFPWNNGYTEWIPLGEFYIDSRSYQNNVWKSTCFDKLILAQQPYVTSLVYPASMSDVLNEICGQLAITLDSSVVINPTYQIPYKDEDITIREMLGYIASAHASSIRITKDSKLKFVKLQAGATATPLNATDYFKAEQTNPLKSYSRIVLTYNSEGETLEVGIGDEDHTLNIYNPFMTESILNDVFSVVNGFSYVPFTMSWKGRPDLEIGDTIEVTLLDEAVVPSVILTNKISFKGGLRAESTAPSNSAQKSETSFKGSLTQQVKSLEKKTIQENKNYYGFSVSRTKGLNVKRDDGATEFQANSDQFYYEADGERVMEFDTVARKLRLKGDFEIEGGSINWNGVNKPTAEQVGAISDTYIDEDGVWTGFVGANSILAGTLTGFTVQTAASGARLKMYANGIESFQSDGKRHGFNVAPGVPSINIYNEDLLAYAASYLEAESKLRMMANGTNIFLKTTGTYTEALGTWDFQGATLSGFNVVAKFK